MFEVARAKPFAVNSIKVGRSSSPDKPIVISFDGVAIVLSVDQAEHIVKATGNALHSVRTETLEQACERADREAEPIIGSGGNG